MASLSPTVSLRSADSCVSSCSEFSVDTNSSARVYPEECSISSQEDSDHSLKGVPPNFSLPVQVNGSHRYDTLVKIESGDMGHIENLWTIRDAANIESGKANEAAMASPSSDQMDVRFWLPPEPEDQGDDVEGSVTTFDDDEDEGNDGMNWGTPSSLSNLGEESSANQKFKEEKRQAMEEVMNGKFKSLVSQLLQSVGVDDSGSNGDSWVDIVTSLSWEAASFVKPEAIEGKAMDPDGYVKVKCIATGSRCQSKLIKGLVFKKHAAHKHMPTKYKNPRLLLIQGALGLSSNGLSSFESMQQEKDSLKFITEMIETHHPDVVLVERTVSRDIQESILKNGMTLVLDMKLHRLERVARCTGSPILSSEILTAQKLRQCDLFHIEKFVEEHAFAGDGGKVPSKTLMFIEGCHTRLGCTILLMGTNSDELKRIKCVVRCAVVMAYHFILETSFLLDQKAMFSTVRLNDEVNLKLNRQLYSSAGTTDAVVSCNENSAVETDSLSTIDIPISDLILEDGTYNINKQFNGSSLAFEPYNPIVLSGLSSISASLKKVVEDSFPIFSASRQSMSTYFGFDGKNGEDHIQTDIPVSSGQETLDQCDMESKDYSNSGKEADCQQNCSKDNPPVCCDETLGEQKYSEQKCSKHDINAVLDSESILVLMSTQNALKGTICEQRHFSHIKFYRNFDVPLGKFLRDNLLNQRVQCKTCAEPPEAHVFYYAHHNKQLTIQVKRLSGDECLPGETEGKLWMWSRCGKCKCQNGNSKSTKRVLISVVARDLSFGKFLELSFSNHSSFDGTSSCGHSFQKDFLYFFGLGPMVAMFKYSKVVTYSVILPSHKLKLSNSINEEFLKKDFENVRVKGISMFLDVEKSLKQMESRYVGITLDLPGSIKEFSDIEEMLKHEKNQFEDRIQHAVKEGNQGEAVYKLLSLNKIRLELLLESCVWDRRLCSLLSYDVLANRTKPIDQEVQQQTHVKEDVNHHQEADVVEIALASDDGCPDKPDMQMQSMIHTSVQPEEFPVEEIPINERVEESKERVAALSSSLTEKVGRQEATQINESGSSVLKLLVEPVTVHSHIDDKDDQHDDNHASGGLPPYKTVNISTDDGSTGFELDKSESQKYSSTVFFNMEDDKGWIWTPFSEIRQEYMKDLQRGYLPKFETITSHSSETTAHKLITGEGSRLHIPLGGQDYVVSDYEDEFSSIIACALALLKDVTVALEDPDEDVGKEKETDTKTLGRSQSLTRMFSLTSPQWSSIGSMDSDGIRSLPSIPLDGSHFSSFDGLDLLDNLVSSQVVHPEVSMGVGKFPGKRKYSVICLYASEFRLLRNRSCPSETDYIASLSRCRNWDAKGGKSKSFFAKTLDDRFIIKEIKRTEFESFMKFAPHYFQYINQCYNLGNQTCLAKIFGIYQVILRESKSGKEVRHDLMVMENLSFGHNIARQYDLKGALHARFTLAGSGSEDVLLDQNFVNDMNVSPLYVSTKSKRNLQRAVWNDTTFLNTINVMDYSLLVGVDIQQRELVCGIIDYLRQYTWDKQLESWVKSSLVVPKNQMPTVISPKEYKKRFRKFIDTHFLSVPENWCSRRSSNPCKLCGMGDDDFPTKQPQEVRNHRYDSTHKEPEEEQGADKQNSYS